MENVKIVDVRSSLGKRVKGSPETKKENRGIQENWKPKRGNRNQETKKRKPGNQRKETKKLGKHKTKERNQEAKERKPKARKVGNCSEVMPIYPVQNELVSAF